MLSAYQSSLDILSVTASHLQHLHIDEIVVEHARWQTMCNFLHFQTVIEWKVYIKTSVDGVKDQVNSIPECSIADIMNQCYIQM